MIAKLRHAWALLTGTVPTWYAIKHEHYGWLVDACAGGAYAMEFGESRWFDTRLSALACLVNELDLWPRTREGDGSISGHKLYRVRVQATGNHYSIKEQPWP